LKYHAYQQSIAKKWYYEYVEYMVINEEFPRLLDRSDVLFQETDKYEWREILTAEDVAKGNQEKISQ